MIPNSQPTTLSFNYMVLNKKYAQLCNILKKKLHQCTLSGEATGASPPPKQGDTQKMQNPEYWRQDTRDMEKFPTSEKFADSFCKSFKTGAETIMQNSMID